MGKMSMHDAWVAKQERIMCVTVKRVCADLLDDDGRRERRGACGFGDVAHHKVQGRVVVTRKQHLCRVLELFRI